MATCPVHWSSLPALSAPPESQFTIIIQIVKIKSSSLLQGVPLPGQSDLLGEDPGDSSEHPAFLCCCLSSIQKKNTLSDLEEDLDLDSEEKGGKGWELLRFAALSFLQTCRIRNLCATKPWIQAFTRPIQLASFSCFC